MCSCIVGKEGGREGAREEGCEGVKGAPNSFGSSCIRVNGTNYKSRAISPHYSAGTRRGGERERERERLALQLSVGDEGRKRKAERVKYYMKNRYEEN